MSILRLQHVQKAFGSKKILQDVNLEIPKGSIYGFIGQNGAGKTTTMKLILGLLKLDEGNIEIDDEQVIFGHSRTNRSVGYLPDVPEFYGYLTAKEYLELCSRIQITDREQKTLSIAELLSFVGLDANSGKIRGFSRGMKQRLGIAQALLGQPSLLICDEPTSALDPVGRKEMLELFQKISKTTTILFSTHILNDVEKICDHVAILHEGSIKENGSLAKLKEKYGKTSCLIEFFTREEQQLFWQQTSFDSQIQNETTIRIELGNSKERPQQIMETLTQLQIVPQQFSIQQPSLEEVFLEVIA